MKRTASGYGWCRCRASTASPSRTPAYRDRVLPPAIRARVAVEAASPIGWHRWVGDLGDVVAMEGFGASAPAKVLYQHFGFTGEAVAERARAVLQRD